MIVFLNSSTGKSSNLGHTSVMWHHDNISEWIFINHFRNGSAIWLRFRCNSRLKSKTKLFVLISTTIITLTSIVTKIMKLDSHKRLFFGADIWNIFIETFYIETYDMLPIIFPRLKVLPLNHRKLLLHEKLFLRTITYQIKI